MPSVESKTIADFKHDHADIFAWLYSNCRKLTEQDEKTADFGKKILNISTLFDKVEPSHNLVDSLRKKVGINPSDVDATKIENIFPDSADTNYNAASGWGEYIRKVFSIDLGAIEELFDEIIDGIMAIYNYIKDAFNSSADKPSKLLEEINIIAENLKNMRANMPLMVHMQTKLEMSQTAKMSVA